MNLLPIEILSKIVHQLNFQDRKSFSLTCLRFNLSTYFKELWNDVTFVIGKTIFPEMHTHFLNILTNIKFFSVKLEPEELHEILKHTHNLMNLDLIICRNLFRETDKLHFHFKKNISHDVKNVLMNLQSLNLRGNRVDLTDISFNILIDNCCNLSRLDLSELEIVGLADSICNWSLDETECGETDWKFSKFLATTPASNDRLTFANIASRLVPLAASLVRLNLSSTQVGRDELYVLVSLPGLKLAGLALDNCKNLDSTTVAAVLDWQARSLCEISALNAVPIPMGMFGVTVGSAKSLRTIRFQSSGSRNTRGPRILLPTTSWHGSRLEHVHIENCSLDDPLVEALNQLSSVRKLFLLGSRFSEVDKARLALPHLKELGLDRSYGLVSAEFCRSIFSHARLTVLRLDWVRMPTGELITGPDGLGALEQLQQLSLVGCSHVEAAALADSLQLLRFIRILRIQGIKGIDGVFVSKISHLTRTLEEINFSGSVLTDGNLVPFLRNASRLRRLRLDDCCNISAQLVTVLPCICPYLQDVSMRNCDQIEHPITLNYYDFMFLYQWHLVNGAAPQMN